MSLFDKFLSSLSTKVFNVHTTQSNPLSVDVSSFWSAVVGCGRELGKAVSESQVNKPSFSAFSSHLLCWESIDTVCDDCDDVSPSQSRPDHTNFPNWNIMRLSGGGGAGTGAMSRQHRAPASDIIIWCHEMCDNMETREKYNRPYNALQRAITKLERFALHKV